MTARNGDPDDTVLVAALLHRAADGDEAWHEAGHEAGHEALHEADRERIVRRLGFEPAGDVARLRSPAGTGRVLGEGSGPRAAHRTGRGAGTRGRFAAALPVGIAAAAVTIVTAVSVLVAAQPDRSASTSIPDAGRVEVVPTTAAPATTGPPATTTASPTAGPSSTVPGGASSTARGRGPVVPAVPAVPTVPAGPAGPAGSGRSSITAGAVPGAPATTTTTAPAAAPGAPAATVAAPPTPVAVTAGVRPVATGSGVTLGGGDWVSVVRRDGTVVRPKHGAVGALDVRWSGAQTGAVSPYRVSWSGGAPEQSHSDATTWLAIGPGGSATITVPPLAAPATLTLYLGAQAAVLTVSGAGRASFTPPGQDVAAVVVTVPLAASSTSVGVTVASANGSKGVVGLAAATLS